MADITFNHKFKLAHMNGNGVDFDTADIQVILLDTGHTLDLVNDEFVADVVADEVAGTNYARKSVQNAALTNNAGTVTFDFDDLNYAQDAAGFTDARYAYLIVNTGNDATSRLIGAWDVGGAGGIGNVAADLDLVVDAAGAFTFA